MARTHLLGIEIGGTKLQVGLGRGDGRIEALERRVVPHAPDGPADAEDVRSEIALAIHALLDRAGLRHDAIAAAGVGFGGPVDAARGVVIDSHQIRGWKGFGLKLWLQMLLGNHNVALQNDADTAALGEARFGAGVGLSPVVYVTIGSGVGGGLVIDGRIYRGAGLGALEIGQLRADDPEGELTVEQVVSGWSIGARAGRELERRDGADRAAGRTLAPSVLRELVPPGCELDARRVALAAARGDELALEVLGRATTMLGRALAHAVTLLAPRRIILGGGVSLIGEDLWFRPIREEVARRAFPPFRGQFEIVPAALGEEVVVHGALALAADAAAQ